MSLSTPTQDDLDELLISCRYGDIEDIQQFVEKFGPDPLATASDDNGNTVLHMVAGNGHTGIVVISPRLYYKARAMSSGGQLICGSHLPIAQKLVKFPGGPGVDLIDIKNATGRSPLGEAENAGWEEGAKWFVEVMNLDESAKGEEELQPAEAVDNIEVEIQDADGQIAKMTIGQSASGSTG
ncbi:cytoplasmic protein [Daedaleopsis nitida]|nr:cytoplasmic protein [Daedaleopsis nitida]